MCYREAHSVLLHSTIRKYLAYVPDNNLHTAEMIRHKQTMQTFKRDNFLIRGLVLASQEE